MYHRIVAMQVRNAFAQISAGNWEAMVAGMAPAFTYRFYGDHALSGERHTHDALRRWWERCFRLLPNTTFDVEDILVAGWPWNTRVATAVTVNVGVVDGSRYQNVVHQFLRIRWGKITEVRTMLLTATKRRRAVPRAGGGLTSERAI